MNTEPGTLLLFLDHFFLTLRFLRVLLLRAAEDFIQGLTPWVDVFA